MKIAVRGGHNFQAIGARGIIDETIEDRKVKEAVIKYLAYIGHGVMDVTPGNCDVNSDLAYGVNKANEWVADLFISIHFNKAYSSYEGAIGTETWIYKAGNDTEELARRIANNIATLGFKNRGVKVSNSLYELRKTNMPAVIVEVCFVEATEDVRLYNEKGYDTIGRLIAEAIGNKKIKETTPVVQAPEQVKEAPKPSYNFRSLQGYIGVSQDNIPGPITLSKCPLLKRGSTGNVVRWLQERLNFLGFNCGSVDGIFGEKTRAAVTAFQSSRGLSADGVVGQNTWRKLLGL